MSSSVSATVCVALWYKVLTGMMACIATQAVLAQRLDNTVDENSIKLITAEQVSYDDNLYRLPGSNNTEVAGDVSPDARRDDFISRTSLATDAQLVTGLQSLQVNALIARNIFKHNDALNHTEGNGKLQLNWATGSALSGKLGGDYLHSLANFANSRVYLADLLDRWGYFGEASYALGPSWQLKMGGRHVETDHGLAERRFDNLSSNVVTGSVEYITPDENLIGVDYRYVKGEFKDGSVMLLGQSSLLNYNETETSLHGRIALGAKTKLEARLGYLKHEYPLNTVNNFDGSVGRMELGWMLSIKTQLSVAGWHELRANQDAESDYFVAQGGSVNLTWLTTEFLQASLQGAREQRRYLPAEDITLTLPRRRDQQNNARAGLAYIPRRWLELECFFAFEQRDSNRDQRSYRDRLSGLMVRGIF